MWKRFFDFMDFLARMIPVPAWRRWVRREKLFDYRAKRDALCAAYPDLDWAHMRLAKGGGSLAFILNNKYVFKVRKHFETDNSADRFAREKRITDAIAPHIPVRVPHIELVTVGKYLFYKTEFIPGRVLVDLPLKKIWEHREKIGRQLGDIIYTMFNTTYPELDNMDNHNAHPDRGLIHGDMCSNIIVNPDTMDVVGIIDWEYAYYGPLKNEFVGLFKVRRKMRLTDIAPEAMWRYYERAGITAAGRKKKSAQK